MANYKTAFGPADILLPRESDLTKWAVVACDQHTSEPEYWLGTEKTVGDSPSALRLILPEAYLGAKDIREREDKIHKTMEEYLSAGIFREYKNAMVYVERTLADGRVRKGIVGAIDLEEYDYAPGSNSQVRATEATVASRIPPRVEIRDGAPLELSHVMLLIDDPGFTVIEPIADVDAPIIYDFDLMQGGGHIRGRLLGGEAIAKVDGALGKLREKCPLTFAVGDGNHSLAAAKAYYEKLKKENPGADMSAHPARYALCEIVNLHSEALTFEAIHRFVKVDDPYRLVFEMSLDLGLSGLPSEQRVKIHRNYIIRDLCIHNPQSKLAVGSVQAFLDGFIERNGGEIDYIHGNDVIRRLASEQGTIGFEFEPIKKEELFGAVIADGALPRKTFSMGEAEDKRYYLEARRIR